MSDKQNYATVFEKRKTIRNTIVYERTSKSIPFPEKLSNDPGFAGVLQTKFEFIYNIVFQNEEHFYKNKDVCYCSICEDMRSAKGGNYAKHAKIHLDNDDLLTKDESIQIVILWALSHNIPFSSFRDKYWRYLFRGWLRNGSHWPLLQEVTEKIQNLIISKLKNAEFIEMSTDGWSCSLGRFQGIIAHISGPNGGTFPLAFSPGNSETMSSQVIADLVQNAWNEFEIDPQKIVGLVTDTTNEMPACAALLNLHWDPCYLHILSLCMGDFYTQLPEEICNTIEIIRSMVRTSKFKDFRRNNSNRYAEISKKWEIQKGCPTRWCSYIKEIKTIRIFLPMIQDFIYEHQEEKASSIDFESFSENLEVLIPSLEQIENLTIQMESEDYNRNVANPVYTFSFIQNISQMFIRNSDRDNLKPAFQALSNAIDARFFESEDESRIISFIAAFLDPHPIHLHQLDAKKEFIQSKLYEFMDEHELEKPKPPVITPNTPESSFSSQPLVTLPVSRSLTWTPVYDKTLEGFLHYRENVPHVNNPQVFWADNRQFPELAAAARIIFAHRPTTISNESWFSKVSRLFRAERRSLTPEHLQILAFLKGNQDLFDEIMPGPGNFNLPDDSDNEEEEEKTQQSKDAHKEEEDEDDDSIL